MNFTLVFEFWIKELLQQDQKIIHICDRNIWNLQGQCFCTTVYTAQEIPISPARLDSPELHLSTFLAGISKDINIMRGLFIRKYEGIDTWGRT